MNSIVKTNLSEGKLDVTGLPENYSPVFLAVDTEGIQYLLTEDLEREEGVLYVGDTSGLIQAQDFGIIEGSEVDIADFVLKGTSGKMILPREMGIRKGIVQYLDKTLELNLLWDNAPEMMSRLEDTFSKLEGILNKLR